MHQGEDIVFPGTTIEDCQRHGDELQSQGGIADYACMVNDDNTVPVTPYYKD